LNIWHKDISQQIWEYRNYQITTYFVPTVIMAGTLHSSDIHIPVSTQDFEFIRS